MQIAASMDRKPVDPVIELQAIQKLQAQLEGELIALEQEKQRLLQELGLTELPADLDEFTEHLQKEIVQELQTLEIPTEIQRELDRFKKDVASESSPF